MILTSNMAPSSWDEFFTGDEALLRALDRVFDKASVFMMRGPSYRGRGLDTYSVEAVPQATRVRGMQPKGVWPLHKLGNRLPAHWPESADRDWRLSPDWMWLNSSGANSADHALVGGGVAHLPGNRAPHRPVRDVRLAAHGDRPRERRRGLAGARRRRAERRPLDPLEHVLRNLVRALVYAAVLAPDPCGLNSRRVMTWSAACSPACRRCLAASR